MIQMKKQIEQRLGKISDKERNVGKEIMQSVFATLICSGPVIIFGLCSQARSLSSVELF